MKLEFAFFANSTFLSADGLFSVLGGGIEWITAASLPAICPNLVLLAKFRFAPEECGKTHESVVKVTDPAGQIVNPDLSVSLQPPPIKSQPENAGSFTAYYRYDRFQFTAPGMYRFNIIVGEVSLGEATLELIEERAQ